MFDLVKFRFIKLFNNNEEMTEYEFRDIYTEHMIKYQLGAWFSQSKPKMPEWIHDLVFKDYESE